MLYQSKKYHTHQFIAYSVAFIALGFTTASLGPMLPTLAEQTSVGLSTVGFLFTARSFGFMLGSFQGGKLLDKFDGHRMIAIAIAVMSLMMFATPLSKWFVVLILVMLLLGIAESVLDVGTNAFLIWTHAERVGPYMNGIHFFYGIGALLTPIVIAWLSSFGHKSAFWFLALLIAPCVLIFLRIPSPHRKQEKDFSENANVNPRVVFLIALVFFLYIGAEVSFGGWIYTYVTKLKLSSETNAAYLTSAFWIAFTVGRLISILLVRRFSLEKLLLIDLIYALLSLSFILLMPNSSTAAWVTTIGLGFSLASFFPTLFSFAERATTITGKTAGRILVGASAGGMTMPWLIGQVFEKVSPQAAMFGIMIIVIADMLAFITLLRLTKESKTETQSSKYDSLLEAQT
jgi:FHS family Na+ dependent glucose MFS transporter 1